MSEEEAKEGKVTSEDFMISITSLSLTLPALFYTVASLEQTLVTHL